MITWLAILTIMPFDFMCGKMIKSRLSGFWKKILFGLFGGQTKGT
jgi:hypothetical protein